MCSRIGPERGVTGLEQEPTGIFEIVDHVWAEIRDPVGLPLAREPRQMGQGVPTHFVNRLTRARGELAMKTAKPRQGEVQFCALTSLW